MLSSRRYILFSWQRLLKGKLNFVTEVIVSFTEDTIPVMDEIVIDKDSISM